MSIETPVRPVAGAVDVDIKKSRFAWARISIVIGVFVLLAVVHFRFYKVNFDGLWDRDATDQGQIAIGVMAGQGYVTRFIRPFNVALVSEGHNKTAELNHAPLYPCTLALAFKVRSISDRVVVWTSMAFLFLTMIATYFLGRLLFDWKAGLLAAAAVGVSGPVLQVSLSGHHWTMAGLWFVLLAGTVALHHRAGQSGRGRLPGAFHAALSGGCIALLYMTHHVLVFLIVPVAVYFAVTGPWRRLHAAVFLAAALVLIAPWSYRNLGYTGFPVLGVNAWDLMADTTAYPGDTFYRSTETNRDLSSLLFFPLENFSAFAHKLISGSSDLVSALASMLGVGVLPFALVSTLYRFKSPTANAVRGLMYGAAPFAVICLALYSADTSATVILVPIAAIYASAYLLLLLEARKLHVFYRRALTGFLLMLMGSQTISGLFWRGSAQTDEERNVPAHTYFSMLSNRGARGPLYTDVPWISAWRCDSWSVWLPTSDADFQYFSAEGFPTRIIVLTPESEKYSPKEIWHVLHKVRLWREYIRDPKDGLRQILQAARVKVNDTTKAQRYMQRLKRDFAVSASIEGFAPQPQDPLNPDDVQVLTRESEE